MSKFGSISLLIFVIFLQSLTFGQDFQKEYNQYTSFGEINTHFSSSIHSISEDEFHWSQIGPSAIAPTSVSINPFLENIIFVGTINGLYVTHDSGSSWEQVDFGDIMPLHDVRIHNVKFSPADTNLVVVTATNLLDAEENKIIISRDRGIIWEEAIVSTTMIRGEIYLSENNADFMFVEAGTLRMSGSGGQFWDEITEFSYVQSFNINPNNEDQIYVLNNNDLHKTVDNGIIWNNVASAMDSPRCVKASPNDNDIVFIGKSSPDAGFLKSIDGGTTWENIGALLPGSHYIENIQFDPINQDELYISGPNTGLLKLNNLGETLTELMTDINDNYVRSVDFFSNGEMAATGGSNLYISGDSRTTWSKTINDIHAADIFEIEFSPNDGNTVYAAALGGVFKTTDAGISWTQLTSGMPDTDIFSISIDKQNPDNLLAGTFLGYILRSSDAGATWSEVFKTDTAKNSNTEAIQDVYFHPTTANIAWANSYRHTFKSEDGGQTWNEFRIDTTDIYGGIAISTSEPEIIYLSDNARSNLFKSTDTGTTWSKIDSIHVISKMIVHPDSSDVLYAQIDGDLRDSRDGGVTWNNLKSNLRFQDVYIPPLQSDFAIISTFGQGILSIPDTGTGAVRITSVINTGLKTNMVSMTRQFPDDATKYMSATLGQSIYISGYDITSVEDEETIPTEFELSQNYPNPFNPTTTIEFSLKNKSKVNLTVYNLLGEVVEKLANEELTSGLHKISFDGRNLSSGIYFYKLETDKFHVTKKMILLK